MDALRPPWFFPLPLGETTLNSLDVGGLISLRDVYVRLGWLPYPLRLLIDFPITRIRGVLRTHSPRSASFRVQPAFPTTNKPSRFLCPTCSRPAAGVFAVPFPPRGFFRSSRPSGGRRLRAAYRARDRNRRRPRAGEVSRLPSRPFSSATESRNRDPMPFRNYIVASALSRE